jgi:hypothetical protein
MNVVNVKLALSTLHTGAKMTQQQIAAELGCTQGNVHYHMNSNSQNSRKPIGLVEGIKAAFARRSMDVPMVTSPVGAL